MSMSLSEAAKSPLERRVDEILVARPELRYPDAVRAAIGEQAYYDHPGGYVDLGRRHLEWTEVLAGDRALDDVTHAGDRELLAAVRKSIWVAERLAARTPTPRPGRLPAVVEIALPMIGGDRTLKAASPGEYSVDEISGGIDRLADGLTTGDLGQLAAELAVGAQATGSLGLAAAAELCAARLREAAPTGPGGPAGATERAPDDFSARAKLSDHSRHLLAERVASLEGAGPGEFSAAVDSIVEEIRTALSKESQD